MAATLEMGQETTQTFYKEKKDLTAQNVKCCLLTDFVKPNHIRFLYYKSKLELK